MNLLSHVAKFFQCSWQEQLLLLYTLALLGIVRLIILFVPFRYIAPYLGQHMVESPYGDPGDYVFVRRVGWAIEIMSRYTPWESKCLVQAITGKILLRHRRLDNTLYLGAARDQNSALEAHAWLRSGRYAVTGGCGDMFTIVAKFADILSMMGDKR